MKKEDLEKMGFKVFNLDIGDRVICDSCSKEWTDRPESGGILVQSKAVCPDCAEAAERGLRSYNEEHLIVSRCPLDKSFADWVRDDLRGGKS